MLREQQRMDILAQFISSKRTNEVDAAAVTPIATGTVKSEPGSSSVSLNIGHSAAATLTSRMSSANFQTVQPLSAVSDGGAVDEVTYGPVLDMPVSALPCMIEVNAQRIAKDMYSALGNTVVAEASSASAAAKLTEEDARVAACVRKCVDVSANVHLNFHRYILSSVFVPAAITNYYFQSNCESFRSASPQHYKRAETEAGCVAGSRRCGRCALGGHGSK